MFILSIIVGSLCTFGTVRLSDGTSKDEGRVELCYNAEWGTFCDLNWDRRDAQVICRELGYSSTCEKIIHKLYSMCV